MIRISRIQVNGQHKGVCITDSRPVIAFSLQSDSQNEKLKRAVIRVGDWSAEVTDQKSICYSGDLKPFTEYKVFIEAEAESGAKASADTRFCTGRLDTLWSGKWITDESYDYGEGESPVPMEFRCSFSAREKNIKKAWINSTAFGIYELQLNGRKVGEDYFAPGYTSYGHLLQYQTYDVTKLLNRENEVKVILAGGWAAGVFHMKRKNKTFADRPAFLGEVHIVYDDGTEHLVATDESWEVTLDGNCRAASFYDGEIYDANVIDIQKHWRRADLTVPREHPQILAEYGAPVRKQ